jgi:hypothetical protein
VSADSDQPQRPEGPGSGFNFVVQLEVGATATAASACSGSASIPLDSGSDHSGRPFDPDGGFHIKREKVRLRKSMHTIAVIAGITANAMNGMRGSAVPGITPK